MKDSKVTELASNGWEGENISQTKGTMAVLKTGAGLRDWPSLRGLPPQEGQAPTLWASCGRLCGTALEEGAHINN